MGWHGGPGTRYRPLGKDTFNPPDAKQAGGLRQKPNTFPIFKGSGGVLASPVLSPFLPMKRFWRWLLGVLRRFLFGINLLTLVPVVLSSLAPYIAPERFFWPNLLALFHIYWLVIPLLWLAGWGLRRRWAYAAVNLLLLGLNYPSLSLTYQSHEPLPASERNIELLSMNVNAFGYDYKHFLGLQEYLRQTEPDIVCLQEFYNVSDRKGLKTDSGKIKRPRALRALEADEQYPHQVFVRVLNSGPFGLLVLSKYPIIDAGLVTPRSNQAKTGIMYADLKLYGERLRLYNAHLASYNFSLRQRRLLGDDQSRASLNVKSGWSLAKVLLHAWELQTEQLNALQAHRREFSDPSVLCADLNNPPYSYFYQEGRGDLQDSFLARGSGRGATYDRFFRPMRIDYVFPSEDFLVAGHRVDAKNRLSDHRPLHVDLRFRFHQ